jgi:hypothetical protein
MRSDEQDEVSEVERIVGQLQPGPFERVRDRRTRHGGQFGHVSRVAPEQREVRLVGCCPWRWWRLALRRGVCRRRTAPHLRGSRLRTPFMGRAAVHGAAARVGTIVARYFSRCGRHPGQQQENRQDTCEGAARHQTIPVSHKGCRGTRGWLPSGSRLQAAGLITQNGNKRHITAARRPVDRPPRVGPIASPRTLAGE